MRYHREDRHAVLLALLKPRELNVPFQLNNHPDIIIDRHVSTVAERSRLAFATIEEVAAKLMEKETTKGT